MGLKWFLNSAFTVLGHTDKRSNQKGGRESLENFHLLKREVSGEDRSDGWFQMPLHYPRYTKEDYEKMEECRLDLLLKQYGLCFNGTLEEKRAFAMGAFLWPDQL